MGSTVNIASVKDIEQAVAVLKAGGLVGMPTETVYGLACDAKNPAAIQHLYAVKGRPGNHPVIVHIGNASELGDWAKDIPDYVQVLAQAFWPGPMTLVLPKQPDVLDLVTGGQNTVGIRVPNHPTALALLSTFGSGLVAPSANRFGHVSPTTASHVRQDLGSDIAIVLEGGACQVGVESTILDCTSSERIRVLRPGMLLSGQVSEALRQAGIELPVLANETKAETLTIRVSGNLESHYAPETPVTLVTQAELLQRWSSKASVKSLAVIAFTPSPEVSAESWLQVAKDPDAYAQTIYANLRKLDALKADAILIETPPENEPGWDAIHDRLKRAAAEK